MHSKELLKQCVENARTAWRVVFKGVPPASKLSEDSDVAISSPFNVHITPPPMIALNTPETRAVTVFCGSSVGNDPAYVNAAQSLGKAIVNAERPLIYGGGSQGIMGLISGTVLKEGGDVTGVVPFAMVAAGGEVDAAHGPHRAHVQVKEKGREKAEIIVVNSMHERKAEMARRSCAFIGLPGGYGTFEEVLEVVCWSQIGIHAKPVIVVNVLKFWEPLRELIRNGIKSGFILPKNEQLICFVDGPEDLAEHATYDWGKATVDALDHWNQVVSSHYYDWTLRKGGKTEEDTLGAA